MKRYRLLLNEFVGYGYTMPPSIVGYRWTKWGAAYTVKTLNRGLTRPLYFYEKNVI